MLTGIVLPEYYEFPAGNQCEDLLPGQFPLSSPEDIYDDRTADGQKHDQ